MLRSIIPGNAFHESCRKRWIYRDSGISRIFCCFSRNPSHKEKPTLSLEFCSESWIGTSYRENRVSLKVTKFVTYLTKRMIELSLRYINPVWYLTHFVQTSSCFLPSSLMRPQKVLFESILLFIWSYLSEFMSELCIDKLVDAFMRNVHRWILWIEELEITSNDIWTPSFFQMFYCIFEYLWSFEGGSPIHFFSPFFTLVLCGIWKIMIMLRLLFFQSVEITR